MNRSRLVGLVCFLLGAAVLWSLLAGPMLVHARFGPMQEDRGPVIWNPLRSKEPEQMGARLLRSIQSPRCREAMLELLAVPDEEQRLGCVKQERRPLHGHAP